MSPSPYLLWVNSKPTGSTTEQQWIEWYTAEHLPDLVNHRASTRAYFYREVSGFPGTPSAAITHDRNFLAMYQSEFKEPLKSKEYLEIRTTSEILPRKIIHDAGEFDARNYEFVDEYDPHDAGRVPAQCIVTVEIQPSEELDFEDWYRKVYIDTLSGLPGYRRSRRYHIGSPVPLLTLSERPPILITHEFDNFDSQEIRMNLAKKKSQGEKSMGVRGWQRLHAEGYE